MTRKEEELRFMVYDLSAAYTNAYNDAEVKMAYVFVVVVYSCMP